MELVLTEICDYLNNYFQDKKITGEFTIEGGTINVPDLKNGQYFRIQGSTFNDGVHKYPIDTEHSPLIDEVFNGTIWAMAVPQTVIALIPDIKAWQAKYGTAESDAMSPYTSESFSGYSYSKGGNSVSGGAATTWQDIFAGRLNKYRKLRGLR